MSRPRIGKHHAVFPPGYEAPAWHRLMWIFASRSPRLREFTFRGLPASRLRTYINAHYFRQVVMWIDQGDIHVVRQQVAAGAPLQIFPIETRHGPDEWEQGFRDLTEALFGLSFVVQRYIRASPEDVVITGRFGGTGTGSGLSLDQDAALHLKVQDGMATYGRVFQNQAEALEAVGLSE